MKDLPEPIHETWLYSDALVPKRFLRPVLEFTRIEAAGGILLLIAAIVAIVWANSAAYESYFTLFNTELDFNFGPIHLTETLKELINDGLMAIFFFVVGLEIKRELVVGELNSFKKASLPAMAALGGMVIPALVYLAFVVPTGDPEAIRGWGIPMATDIAFSVGVVALLGARVSVGAKLFLLALAIVDDIGAIAVIAVFYTDQLNFGYLVMATGFILIGYFGRRAGITSMVFYVPLAVVIWYGFLESGVHATIAGVVLGLLTPVVARYTDEQFRQKTVQVLDRWDEDRVSPHSEERLDQDALELAEVARHSVSPLDRLEHTLHPWSSFLIVPLFALANAGVRFVGQKETFTEQLTSPILLGVAVGLMVGKPIGIALATWIGLKLKLGVLPKRTSMATIIGLGALAGIGFTVSLFVTELAFRIELFANEAKLGIFIGSGIAGIVGATILWFVKTPPDDAVDESDHLVDAPDSA
jgi:NhaA family Na+:H+ antiporter